jgi:hypothetical protein
MHEPGIDDDRPIEDDEYYQHLIELFESDYPEPQMQEEW